MYRSQIRVIIAASFFISFTFGVILTLPLYLTRTMHYDIPLAGRVVSLGIVGIVAAFLLIPRLFGFRSGALAAAGGLLYTLSVALILTGTPVTFYLSGAITGLACGFAYTIGPVMISEFSNDRQRARNFSFIAAFNVLGVGAAPAVVRHLGTFGVSHMGVFWLALVTSLISALLFYLCRHPQGHFQADAKAQEPEPGSVPFRPTARTLIPAVMVLLSGCVFSSMMNFQTLMATERQLDFSFFYLPYTAAVLISRFTLTDVAIRIGRGYTISFLVALMAAAVMLFILVDSDLFYILPSVMLGVGYGLSYPLLLAEAVSHTDREGERKRIITLLIFTYNIGIYCFPYLFSLSVSHAGFNLSFALLAALALLEFIFSLGLLIMNRRGLRQNV